MKFAPVANKKQAAEGVIPGGTATKALAAAIDAVFSL